MNKRGTIATLLFGRRDGKSRRPWPLRWFRRTVVLALLLGLAYVTLPWWIPTDWLRGRIISQLQQDTNRPVYLRSLEVSWSQGVVLHDLRIARREGFGEGDLLYIERASAPLTPIRTLTTGRLKRLDLQKVRVDVVRNEDGDLNISNLHLPRGMDADHVTCGRVHIVLTNRKQNETAEIELVTLQLGVDPSTGRIDAAVSGQVSYSPPGGERTTLGSFGTQAYVIDPLLTPPDADLKQGGKLNLNWKTVDLESLTISDWAIARDAGLRHIAGVCDGKLQLTIARDGRIGWVLDVKVGDLDIELDQAPHRLHIPSGRAAVAGQFDTATRNIALKQLVLDCPGLKLDAAVDYRQTNYNYLGLTIRRAQVNPALLAGVAPELMRWLDPNWQLAGDVVLTGEIIRSDRFANIDLKLDAGELNARIPGWLDKPAGLPARAEIDARYQRDIDRLDVRRVALTLGGSRLDLQAEADELYPVAVGRLDVWDVWLNWMGRLELDTPEAGELLARLPALRRAMGSAELSGPARAQVLFKPIFRSGPTGRHDVQARRLTADVLLGPGSRLTVPGQSPGDADLLAKTGDGPLGVSLECLFAPDHPTVREGRFAVILGEAETPGQATLAMTPFSGKLAITYPRDPNAGPRMDAVLDGQLAGRNLDRFIGLSPRLDRWLADNGIALAGNLDGQVNLRTGRGQIRTHVALDLGGLDMHATNLHLPAPLAEQLREVDGASHDTVSVRKPAGMPAEFVFDYTEYPVAPAGKLVDGSISLTLPGGKVVGTRIVDAGRETRRFDLEVTDLPRLIAHVPECADLCRRLGVDGSVRGSVAWEPGPQHVFDLDLDATDLAVGRYKHRGDRLTLTARVGTDLPDAPTQPTVSVRQASLHAGGSRVQLHGQVQLDPAGWDQALPLPINTMDLVATGQVVPDATLARLWPALGARIAQLNAAGRVDLYVRAEGEARRLRFTADLDATPLAMDLPDIVRKPAGVIARGQITGDLSPELTFWQNLKFVGRLDTVSLSGRGLFRRRDAALGPANFEAHVDVDAPDLGRLADLCPVILSDPALLDGPLAGRIRAELNLHYDGRPDHAGAAPRLLGPITLHTSELHLEGVKARVADTPVSADGRLVISDHSLFVPQLAMGLGDSRLALSGKINDPAGKPAGWINIAGRQLDVDELIAFWKKLQTLPAREQARRHMQRLGVHDPERAEVARQATALAISGTQRAFEAVSQPVGPPMKGQPEAPRPGPATERQTARRIIDFAARTDIRGKVHLADVYVTDAKNQTRYRLSEFKSDFVADSGRIRFPFQTAMEGGTLTGTVRCNLTAEEPMLLVDYDASRLFPTDRVQPLVEAFFPGMDVTGYVTMKEANRQKLLPAPGEDNWPVGNGEIIFEDGLLVGQAGPDWMVKVFPGLKLTEYRFERMHNWFTLSADGRANHHMIFEGESYDIYMIGHTHRGTGEARYTVGVDLLASLDSKTWSVELHQGKIPLMYVSGRIENRELADPKFTMVPPTTALWQMLIRNNILYRGVIERAIKKK